MMPALEDLHPAMAALLDGLEELHWPRESRADCGNCPMLEASGEHTAHAFLDDARCCTAHPRLANFLAGRALAGGGDAAIAIRARLADASGVSSWGVRVSEAWQRRFDSVGDVGFGHDRGLRCPYWRGGELACSLWQNRPGLCRTWFCRHDGGQGAAWLWDELRLVLGAAEDLIARACVEDGSPPEGSDSGAWERWFIDCDRRAIAALARVDRQDPVSIAARAKLGSLARRLELPPLPAILVPAIREHREHAAGLRVVGYSSFDPCAAPPDLFEFLAALDGRRPWREALAFTSPPFDEAVVHELYRVGAIEAPCGPSLGDRLRALPIDD